MGPAISCGKKCYEQTVVEKIKTDDAAYIGVDQKGDLLKSEERNSQRQGQRLDLPIKAEQCADVRCDEASVFEIAEQKEVESQSDEENPEASIFLPPNQGEGKSCIAPDRQQQIHR